MSAEWWQSDWAVVVALLACEAALIGCVAWLAQRRLRSARRRLIVWQSALLAVFAVALGELGGVGPALVKTLSQETAELATAQPQFSIEPELVAEEKPLIRELVEQRLREKRAQSEPHPEFAEIPAFAPVSTPPKALQSMTLGWIWMIGSALLLCLVAGRRTCFWVCSRRFKRVDCPRLRDRLETVARRLGVNSKIDLRISHRLTTPAAYGLMRPAVGLPAGFEVENSVERQEALLAHELAHLRARDPWWHLGADLLTAALWWQPLVWWMAGRMKSASESAADEGSLCVENGPEALAECLVEFGKRLTPRSVASAIGMAGSGYTSRLGQRVEALLGLAASEEPAKPTGWQTLFRIGGAALMAGVGLGLVACCAPRSVGDTKTPLAMTREVIVAPQPAIEVKVAKQVPQAVMSDVTPESKKPSDPLERIVFPEIYFDDLPLGGVARFLTAESVRVDPEKKGLKFTVAAQEIGRAEGAPSQLDVFGNPIGGHGPITPPLVDAFGQPIAAGAHKPTKLQNLPISVQPALKSPTLKDALAAIVAASGGTVEYTVTPGKVSFERVDTEAVVMNTEWAMKKLLAMAGNAKRYDDLEASTGFYEDCIQLTHKDDATNLGTMVQQAVDGLTTARYEIAKGYFQNQEFPEAVAQMDLLLKFVPKSETGVKYKSYVKATQARHRGTYKATEKSVDVPAYLASKKEVAGLIQDGKFLYEMRLFDQAKKKLRTAIVLDPKAKAAYYYLSLIQEAEYGDEARKRDAAQKQRLAEVERAWNEGLPLSYTPLPTPNPYFRTNDVGATGLRFRAVRFKELMFDGLPLGEVVKFLNAEVKKLEPLGKGVDISVRRGNDGLPARSQEKPVGPAPLLDAFGQPIVAAATHARDLEKVGITIKPPLLDVSLDDALDAIASGADRPIHFVIEDGVVIFTHGPKPETLYTRVFKVDPKRFMENVEAMAGIAKPDEDKPKLNEKSEDMNPDGIRFVTRTNSVSEAAAWVRTVFSDAGVKLENDQGKPSGTQVFFNDRNGVLMVRATLKDMEIIETVVEILSAEPEPNRDPAKRNDNEGAAVKVAAARPGLVTIEAKFMEITLNAEKTQAGETLPTTLSALAPGLELTRIDTSDSLRAKLASIPALNSADNVKTNSSIQIDGYSSHHWAGRLNPAQFPAVLRTFEQTDGVAILSAPRVTTKDGRQAVVAVNELMTLPSGLQSTVPADDAAASDGGESRSGMEEIPVGISLGLLPLISSDRKSVRMTVIPNHTEFLGFDEPSEHIGRAEARKLKKAGLTMAFPRIRVRSTLTEVDIKDGETYVIGLPTVTDESVERKGLFRRKRKIANAKHLVVFVTPTIVDEAGNPVNARK